MQGKFNFITLNKVLLRNFTLYSKKGKVYEVNEEIDKKVYCLAGANGLGKTTFLNAINFGLTGIVLEPDKAVFSPSEIVKLNYKYTERYFGGRISSSDAKKSEIEILFNVNGKYCRIIRNFFQREELRLFEVFVIQDGKKVSQIQDNVKSPTELNELYQKFICIETGFSDFDYFLFYQLYVLTFDENRRMIFWDDRASRHAIAIAFNSDPEDANKIADLTRKIEKHDSNARNARYQAKLIGRKIEDLKPDDKKKKIKDVENIEDEYKNLSKDLEKQERILNNINIEHDSMLKRQSYLNSEIMHLKNEHSKLFSLYSKPRSKLVENTNVRMSLSKQECCLCGTVGSYIVESIERNIHKDSCPLCNTVINESTSIEQSRLLKSIEKNDVLISDKGNELDNLTTEIETKALELEKAEFEYNMAKEKLEEFMNEFSSVSFIDSRDNGIGALLDQYEKQYDSFVKESKDEYKKRDLLKPDYAKLLKKVEIAYREAEKSFVPIFKKLAKSFIGQDLNIQVKRSDKTIKLVLELKKTARTESFQLSESQRFFLDIALRMALSVFLSKKNSPATMFIDTPEGSLDIAYESRVGNMFAQYATDYDQNLFLTANINPSRLLISLAEECGKSKMQFRRMLDWTDLTTVQKEGEGLFQQVYRNIEKALLSKK
ncbi:hypothetical protein DLM76_20775 [Leptospira yasudae]|uniref:AAA family ATPase n=2 Tax=Leptospiraceae TaxID=170 RepID=UPI0002BE75BB|nr:MULTISPECIES: AAA family ATPase [Leptospira]EMK01086.1 AAA domain protein [Leptospira sp. B5-022]RHX90160.1 hypothetical protein DLM76_20775 [Leptospira yasudae]